MEHLEEEPMEIPQEDTEAPSGTEDAEDAKDIKTEIFVGDIEEVIVKVEPEDMLMSDPIQVMKLREPSERSNRDVFASPTRNKGHKPKPKKPRRKRSVKSTSLTEDIKPIVNQGPTCRFCLRGITSKSLKKIHPKQEDKARDAFQIIPNDTYPFSCFNCLTMLDMFFDFKESVLKVDKLLQSSVSSLEYDGWDEPDLLDAFTKCKKAMQLHRKVVDKMYTKKFKQNKQEQGLAVDEKCGLIVEPHSVDLEVVLNDDPKLYSDDDHFAPATEDQEELSDETTQKHSSEHIEPIKLSLERKSKVNSNERTGDKPRFRRSRNKAKKEGNADEESVSAHDDDVDDDDYKPDKQRKTKSFRTGQDASSDDTDEEVLQKPKKITKAVQELCDLCGTRVCPQAAESHKNRHLGIKPYSCPSGCELTFYSKYTMDLHIKRFHSEKTHYISRTCNICGKIIRGRKGDLKIHEKLHELKEKSHVCAVCGKGFTLERYLRQHSMTHGEFPHKCCYCGKRFNNKWSMKAHEKNMHEKRNSFPSVDDQPENVVNDAEAEGMALAFESFQ